MKNTSNLPNQWLWKLITIILLASVIAIAFGPGAPSDANAEGSDPPIDPNLDVGLVAPHETRKPDISSLSSGLYELVRAWGESKSAGMRFAEARGFDVLEERVRVTFTLEDVEAVHPLLTRIEESGGSVDARYERWVDAWLPIAAVRRLAVFPGVVFLSQPTPVFPLEDLKEPANAPLFAGSYLTEGVAASNADDWHTAGLTGEGVQVAVLDSFKDYVTAQSLGELPSSIATHGGLNTTRSRHGTAVAEIIHDMAPDADLTFASPGSSTQMASYISDLAAAGNHVIRDQQRLHDLWDPVCPSGRKSGQLSLGWRIRR